MSRKVGKSSGCAGSAAVRRRRTVRWNETAANATATTARVTAAATLPVTSCGAEGRRWKRTHRHDDEKSKKVFHSILSRATSCLARPTVAGRL